MLEVLPGRRPRRRRRRDRRHRRRTPGPAGWRAVLPRGGRPQPGRRPTAGPHLRGDHRPCRRPRRRHGPRAEARGRRDRVPPRRRARAREELAPARPRAHGEGLRRQRHRSGAADEALPAAAPARRQVDVRHALGQGRQHRRQRPGRLVQLPGLQGGAQPAGAHGGDRARRRRPAIASSCAASAPSPPTRVASGSGAIRAPATRWPCRARLCRTSNPAKQCSTASTLATDRQIRNDTKQLRPSISECETAVDRLGIGRGAPGLVRGSAELATIPLR